MQLCNPPPPIIIRERSAGLIRLSIIEVVVEVASLVLEVVAYTLVEVALSV